MAEENKTQFDDDILAQIEQEARKAAGLFDDNEFSDDILHDIEEQAIREIEESMQAAKAKKTESQVNNDPLSNLDKDKLKEAITDMFSPEEIRKIVKEVVIENDLEDQIENIDKKTVESEEKKQKISPSRKFATEAVMESLRDKAKDDSYKVKGSNEKKRKSSTVSQTQKRKKGARRTSHRTSSPSSKKVSESSKDIKKTNKRSDKVKGSNEKKRKSSTASQTQKGKKKARRTSHRTASPSSKKASESPKDIKKDKTDKRPVRGKVMMPKKDDSKKNIKIFAIVGIVLVLFIIGMLMSGEKEKPVRRKPSKGATFKTPVGGKNAPSSAKKTTSKCKYKTYSELKTATTRVPKNSRENLLKLVAMFKEYKKAYPSRSEDVVKCEKNIKNITNYMNRMFKE
ncbi:MAG: hypothetical protein U9O87_06250 [Verrucomicrobiota bacterium]|nr:hypothetical protein [Verrucomicrobiota bacterium]